MVSTRRNRASAASKWEVVRPASAATSANRIGDRGSTGPGSVGGGVAIAGRAVASDALGLGREASTASVTPEATSTDPITKAGLIRMTGPESIRQVDAARATTPAIDVDRAEDGRPL